MRKYRSSGFWGTNLDLLLRSNGIESVVVTGCTTEGCVESTARDALFNEYGPGQQEISIRHAPALRAADNQIKLRDTVRGTALQHGLLASFAPKPYPDAIGSGYHIHFSLWDTDEMLPTASCRIIYVSGASISQPDAHNLGHLSLSGGKLSTKAF